MHKILENIYRFDEQYFYGEPVSVYLIELKNELLLFDIPEFTELNLDFINSFAKPIRTFLSHGSTGIPAGSIWQEKLQMNIHLHNADENSGWLRIRPDVLFEQPITTSEYEIIHTPGHTPGSICLFHNATNSLFTGDTLAARSNNYIEFNKSDRDDDYESKIKSIYTLSSLKFNNILPFHYEMLLGSASELLLDLTN